MPYRELLNHTVWDAVSLSTLAERRASIRLFGSVSDRLAKTNVVVPEQFPSDSAMIIRNWFARTNLPDRDTPYEGAWRTFLHTTIVRLIVGERLMAELPLSELMGQRSPLEGQYHNAVVARDMYRLFAETISPPGGPAGPLTGWDDLTDDERRTWISAARIASYFSIPVIVPVRSTYRVDVVAVAQIARDLMTSMTPEQASGALIWVHLEGILQRALI